MTTTQSNFKIPAVFARFIPRRVYDRLQSYVRVNQADIQQPIVLTSEMQGFAPPRQPGAPEPGLYPPLPNPPGPPGGYAPVHPEKAPAPPSYAALESQLMQQNANFIAQHIQPTAPAEEPTQVFVQPGGMYVDRHIHNGPKPEVLPFDEKVHLQTNLKHNIARLDLGLDRIMGPTKAEMHRLERVQILTLQGQLKNYKYALWGSLAILISILLVAAAMIMTGGFGSCPSPYVPEQTTGDPLVRKRSIPDCKPDDIKCKKAMMDPFIPPVVEKRDCISAMRTICESPTDSKPSEVICLDANHNTISLNVTETTGNNETVVNTQPICKTYPVSVCRIYE